MRTVLLLIVLSIFTISQARRKKGKGGGGGGQCNPTQSQIAPGDFQYYVFATQWAGGACYENDQCRPNRASEEFWNIHGLWPSDGKPRVQGQKKVYYGCCTGDDFDSQIPEEILSSLKTYWPSLYSKNSDSWFHEHEWTKHGTCSGLKQNDFFSATLNLAKNLSLYAKLQEQGIVPRDEPYDCKEIVGALEKAYGEKKFDIASRGRNKQKYISELHICVDRDLAKVVDCTDGNSRSCKGKIYYPLDTSMLSEEENIFSYDQSDSVNSEADVNPSPLSNDDENTIIDLDNDNSRPSFSNDDSVNVGTDNDVNPGSFDL